MLTQNDSVKCSVDFQSILVGNWKTSLCQSYILFSDCVKVKEKEKIDLLFDGGH